MCFVEAASGDAIVYWTYSEEAILVRAVNEHGEPEALYAYFADIARFIAP